MYWDVGPPCDFILIVACLWPYYEYQNFARTGTHSTAKVETRLCIEISVRYIIYKYSVGNPSVFLSKVEECRSSDSIVCSKLYVKPTVHYLMVESPLNTHSIIILELRYNAEFPSDSGISILTASCLL